MFECAGCGAALTAPLTRVALPDHADQRTGYWLTPALLPTGVHAEDRDHVVVAPGDLRDVRLLAPERSGACCGLIRGDEPNLRCGRCDRGVGSLVDDCGQWRAAWLDAAAVRRVPEVEEQAGPVDWTALLAGFDGLPPDEADELWGVTRLTSYPGWGLRWEAAAGVMLAHLVVAAAGGRPVLPEGPVRLLFGPVAQTLFSEAGPERVLVLEGPGLPAVDADLALVPKDPVTGRCWSPRTRATPVPLAAEFWAYLAHHRDDLLRPATGRLPEGVDRDHSGVRTPPWSFRPDLQVHHKTLRALTDEGPPR